MNPIIEILKLVSEGQQLFEPTSSCDSGMKEFQSVAKVIIYANEENFFNECNIHRESDSSNNWYDFVFVSGLSYKGKLYLNSEDENFDGAALSDTIILQPNFAGIGIDIKALFKYVKALLKSNKN